MPICLLWSLLLPRRRTRS